jgi:hypothetical protein
MGTQDRPDLTHHLETLGPASLLAIGAGAADLLTAYKKNHEDCRIACLDADGALDAQSLLDDLAGRGRFDFIIVRGVLERIDEQSGAHLLASLRDLHTRRFCVVLGDIGDDGPWQAPQLIAMGLSRWSCADVDDAGQEIYGFDLGTYKATPTWLNARHWAHPQHWGKFRW